VKSLFLALVVLLIAFASAPAREIVVTIPYTSSYDVSWCTDRGYGVDYVDGKIIRMVVTPPQMEELQNSGHLVTVEVPDLAAHERQVMGWDNPNSPADYDTYEEIVSQMTELANTYPDICQLKTLGTSVNGNTLYALKISKDVNQEDFEPEVRLVGVHHGNEAISGELCLYWTRDLLQNYGTDEDSTYIVDHYELWSQPVVNPDGYIANTRYNAHGIDLNRNYSYMWDPMHGSTGSKPFSEPETQAVRDYSVWDGATDTNNFVASLTYHSGATCCNTVWNYADADHPDGYPHPTPDDNLIMWWGNTYTSNCSQPGFYLTNGCDWYATWGDLNDWSYGERGDMDYTIEVYSQGYNPPASQIQAVYDMHKTSMTLFFRDVDKFGIYGRVAQNIANSTQPLKANILATDLDAQPPYTGWYTYNDPTVWGDYYRPLMPGTYDVTCEPQPEGIFPPVTVENVTVNEMVRTRLDFCFPYLTGVNLQDLAARANPRGVQVNWSVSGDTGIVSYNIYRRRAGTGKDSLSGFARLNSAPIRGGNKLSYMDSSVAAGTSYEYGLGIMDNNGVEVHYGPVNVSTGKTGIAFRLYNNAPNPFANMTTLRYDISKSATVELRIYDLAGRMIRRIGAGDIPAGSHTLAWDGRDATGKTCSAGIYTAVMTAGGEQASLKMIKANR
jgi:hypothetical protein